MGIDNKGGIIASVDEGSPAQRAGLAPGMAITAVDGQPLQDIIDWMWLTDGDEVELEVVDEQNAGVSPDALPQSPVQAAPPTQTAPATQPPPPTPTTPHTPPPTPTPHTITLRRQLGESWGINFTDPLFNGLMTCCNNCEFCFLRMLPKGLRPSLYLKDDDYRLSFLQGNFVTLTNLSDQDIQRIISYHLSPLHVSLHAIDPNLRHELIGPRHARGLSALEQLLDAGIDIHAQIVLVPGRNTGPQLDHTLAWIAPREHIRSVGIVPYGYTRYAGLQYSFTPQDTRALILQVSSYQRKSLARTGRIRFQLADEWYVHLGQKVPAATYYDGFPQYEDGIGMLRSFMDDWAAAEAEAADVGELAAADEGGLAAGAGDAAEVSTWDTADTAAAATTTGTAAVTAAAATAATTPTPIAAHRLRQQIAACNTPVLITGEGFAPTLHQLTRALGVQVLAIRNNFLGGNVDVAGLLTAADIIGQVGECQLAEDAVLIVPGVIFNDDGLTLDDARAQDIAQAVGHPVVVVPC